MAVEFDPRTEILIGERALSRGDFAAAATALRRALNSLGDRTAPGIANAWFNLGYAERAQRHFDSALTAYDRAIASGLERPADALINQAAILSDHLERMDEARDTLEAALRVAPRHPVAMLNLAILHEDVGDRDGAAALYREMLRADPLHPTALSRLAAIDIAAGRAAETIEALKIALGQPGWSPDDAAEMSFALANALDAMARYDEAIGVAHRANALAIQTAAARAAPYDPAAADRLIDGIIAAFPGKARAVHGGGPQMIFICGMFRSGSTLAERIVAAHPAVWSGGELEALPAIAGSIDAYPRAPDATGASVLRERYLTEVRTRFPDAHRVTDKRPDNFLHIGLIDAILPEATILHTRRHPLDTLVSAYFLNFQSSVPYAQRLSDAAHWYRGYARLMAHWRATLPGRIHDVEYEALVTNPAPVVRGMLNACDLPFDATCLDHRQAAAVVRTASVWQVRQPLHDRSVGRWRHYAQALADFGGLAKG